MLTYISQTLYYGVSEVVADCLWLQDGYYLPDAELVRENYQVKLPALHDLSRFGIYIAYDCRFYSTYQLIRDDDFVRGLTFSSCYSSNNNNNNNNNTETCKVRKVSINTELDVLTLNRYLLGTWTRLDNSSQTGSLLCIIDAKTWIFLLWLQQLMIS